MNSSHIGIRLSLTLVLILAAVGCGSEDAERAEPTAASDPGAPATPASPGCSDDLEPQADPWADLEQASDHPEMDSIAALVRDRTDHLLPPAGTSCTGFAVVDRGLDPDDFGAVAVRTFEHQDPYLRFDVVVYESAAAARAVNSLETVEPLIAGTLPPDSDTLRFIIEAPIVIVQSNEDNGEPFLPPDVALLVDDYAFTGLE